MTRQLPQNPTSFTRNNAATAPIHFFRVEDPSPEDAQAAPAPQRFAGAGIIFGSAALRRGA
ncbi:hypothetical protein [Pseudarthrobacter enclensis]|uniref:Uncharacterized protein n=1 Tax=Pseudarthrobacter enclensis TaxID=993070 RepID=A0ABT9RQR0_9MICC|nr:hypothetical protein [Pseudarthrobacter enclensis]MDP9887554.1 hypothetical protein [Pseudarthrobacter enclensis]